MKKYTIGIDFGSLSGRAVLADVRNGEELADAVLDYPHAVMSETLAATGAPLPPAFALQDPADYVRVLETVIPEVLRKANVRAEEVAGICLDFTCCTVLPIRADGTPLCFEEKFRGEPQAYVKLWKHHAAQKYADRMTEVARARGEAFLDRFGGAVSSEWMLPKLWQTMEEAPEVYEAADAFIEAGDWLDYLLTGKLTRGYLFATYKTCYVAGVGYPSHEYLRALDPRLDRIVEEKLYGDLIPAGTCAGTVTAEAAARFSLAEGTPVSVSVPDAHVAASALGISACGDMFGVLGTSGCFMLIGDRDVCVKGTCGTAKDGLLPGYYGYEAGLCCVGDHFAFAAENLTSPAYVKEAEARGIPMIRLLIEKAAKKKPGESGVLALNWWNGNRSTLVNSDLSGLFVGMTLSTAPEDLMRALIEATAFGWRNIVENFRANDVPVNRIIASGGIARKDPFTMQVYADVLNMDIRIAETAQAPALGSAINAAVAAGIYPSFREATAAMARVSDTVYHPIPENTAIYDELYAEYMTLHDYFGKGGNNVMARLRALRARAKEN